MRWKLWGQTFLTTTTLMLAFACQGHSPTSETQSAQAVTNTTVAYAVEYIKTPDQVAPEVGGLAFDDQGTLYVVLRRHGVIKAQPTSDPQQFKWTFLTRDSLHNGCGIVVLGQDDVLISQMAEMTRVKDEDGDGIADSFTNFCDQWGLTGNYHETNHIVSDGKGGFYIAVGTASSNGPIFKYLKGQYSYEGHKGRNFSGADYKGWVLHVDKKGKITPFAKGFRMHNGITVSPSGNVFCTDNQGDWRGASPLYHVEKDKFYGHPASLVWDPKMSETFKKDWNHVFDLKKPLPTKEYDAKKKDIANKLEAFQLKYDQLRTRAAVEIPHAQMCRSASEPVFDTTAGKFGPFAGQVFIGDNASNKIIRCMLEKVNGVTQGACTVFIKKGLRSGNNRLVFSPDGKSLYIGQTVRGWGRPNEGLQRVTFTGYLPFEVLKVSLTKTGFKIYFTRPLKKADLLPSHFEFTHFHYKYQGSYGGLRQAKTKVEARSVKVSSDKKVVTVELPEVLRHKIYQIRVSPEVVGDNGKNITFRDLYYTVNELR